MTPRGAFWAVLGAAGLGLGSFALGLLSVLLSADTTLAGLKLTACGRLLGRILGLDAPPDWRLSAFTIVGAAMLAAAVASCFRTVLATRRALVRLVSQPAAPAGTLETLTEELNLQQRITLVCSQRLFCFTYGLIRPRVCLSTGLVASLGEAELRAVLRHEEYHVRERDPLKGAIASALAAALFPVPVVRWLRSAYLTARELAADRAAMADSGRRPLAQALHTLLAHPDSLLAGFELAPMASRATLDHRLRQLATGSGFPLRPAAGSLLLSLVAPLALWGLVTHRPAPDPASALRPVGAGGGFETRPYEPVMLSWHGQEGADNWANCCIQPMAGVDVRLPRCPLQPKRADGLK
jgi:Zn-dependent protease with chaperone function